MFSLFSWLLLAVFPLKFAFICDVYHAFFGTFGKKKGDRGLCCYDIFADCSAIRIIAILIWLFFGTVHFFCTFIIAAFLRLFFHQ